MSYTDDSSDQEWKEETKTNKKTIKQEHNASGGKPKYLQRFCENWLNIFQPWLARCDDDPHKPFCRACQCRLDCNRCHLHRHARTFKHARNLEILLSKGESAARENLCIRQERSKYYQQRKKLDVTQDVELTLETTEDYMEDTGADTESNFHFVQTEAAYGEQFSDEQPMKQEIITPDAQSCSKRKLKEHTSSRGSIKRSCVVPMKKERNKLLMQIQKDKINIMDSFKEFISSGTGISHSHSPIKERNHVDMFFESVSSSVKALTPKLIAEAKMRVSQLICELELRALTESDGAANQTNVTTPMVIVPEPSNTYNVNLQQQPTAFSHQTHEGLRRSQYEVVS